RAVAKCLALGAPGDDGGDTADKWFDCAERSRKQALVHAWRALALCELHGGRTHLARELAATCLQNLGVAYTDRGSRSVGDEREESFRKAEAAVKQAQRLRPASADYLFELSRVYAAWEKLDLSEAAYRQAIAIRPSGPVDQLP